MKELIYDSMVIGGGVVGCAIMRRLTLQGLKPILLEKGGDILNGASKANSAVLHTGFDAPSGSLELELMQKGYDEYLDIYEKFNLPIFKTGAFVVAWNEEQLDSLQNIVKKAHINGVKDVKIISKEELLAKEVNLSTNALGAISVPREYVIDSWSSPLAYLTQAIEHGASYSFDTQVISGERVNDIWHIKTTKGEFKAKYVINSAGNYADIVQRICDEPPFEMKPRKGQFLVYEKAAAKEVNAIILPVPTKITKGVLLSKTIYGNLILGPTAQEQDNKDDSTVQNEVLNDLITKGTAIYPHLKNYTVTTTYAGLRTATNHNEYLIYPCKGKNWICVGGIRSTGLTSALGIASYVFDMLKDNFDLKSKAISQENIIWPKMPMLSDEYKRDYEEKNSGEILCHCENVTKREANAVFCSKIIPNNLQGFKRRTRAMMGICNGFNCSHRVNIIVNEQIKNKVNNEKEYDVIIIGSGPSGLGIAKTLEKSNKSYLVLERESYIGGIPITCEHHSFGLKTYFRPMKGKDYIKKIVKDIDVNKIKVNHTVVEISEDGSIKARNTNGNIMFKAKQIVIATGCRESHRHQRLISGLRPKEIYTTGSLQRLIEANIKVDFQKPVIIGTEVVSFSALMTCFTNNIKPVAMVENKSKLDTFFALKLLPMVKDVPVYLNSKIKDIKTKNKNNMQSIELEIDGKNKNIECDALIFTGKFVPEQTLIFNSNLHKHIKDNIIDVDISGGNLNNTNIWSCGNILHPGLSGDLCFYEGKKIGKDILIKLNQ